MAKKKVKIIKIDLDKCHGCRACEVACAAFHAKPKYGAVNPARSRIRVFRNELKNVFVPVQGSFYTKAECPGRHMYVINGNDQSAYDEDMSMCSFCGAACPSRDLFKEPDSGLPLKCDMCESDPPLDKPMCVKWCLADALIYEEREEEGEEEPKLEEVDTALECLVDKFGMEKVIDGLARMNQKS